MHAGNPAQAPLNPGLVFEMLQAHQRTAALKAAIELDVFRAVGEGPGDVASIARHCAASERGIRILCDFLTINGVLVKENGHYRHTPTSAAFLDPRSPACLASIAQFLGNQAMNEPYNQLAQVVRSGRTVLAGEGSVEPENPIWVQFAETMGPMMGPMAGPLGAVVLEGHSGPMHVLDIAAGHGLFGIEIAKQNPQAHVTGLDWAPVLRVALENARKAGVQDRYNMLPGSAFEVDFAGPYDAVLLTNFLHHFDKPTCVTLLKNFAQRSSPAGVQRRWSLSLTKTASRHLRPHPSASPCWPQPHGANAYTLSELSKMYTDAGFTGITTHPIPMSPHTIVMGRA